MRGLIARWEWYDWFMIALRICWCISIIALLWEVEGQWSFPFWIKMVIAFIVISVPYLVMRINQHLYAACELLLPGVILFLLNKSNPAPICISFRFHSWSVTTAPVMRSYGWLL